MIDYSSFMDTIVNQAKEEMTGVLELTQEDINSVRAGRAKPSLVEEVKVEAYGTKMRLKELASVNTPDPQSLVIKPWDGSVLEAIRKGIMQANIGLNPVVDSNLVRINIPPLTGEQRQDLVKLVDQKAESGKVMVRQVRMSNKTKIESRKGEPGVSEDHIHQGLENLQQLTDEFIKRIEQVADEKKEEITTL
jgi:ribosome recycling factor